jgi:hypothetical protein
MTLATQLASVEQRTHASAIERLSQFIDSIIGENPTDAELVELNRLAVTAEIPAAEIEREKLRREQIRELEPRAIELAELDSHRQQLSASISAIDAEIEKFAASRKKRRDELWRQIEGMEFQHRRLKGSVDRLNNLREQNYLNPPVAGNPLDQSPAGRERRAQAAMAEADRAAGMTLLANQSHVPPKPVDSASEAARADRAKIARALHRANQ